MYADPWRDNASAMFAEQERFAANFGLNLTEGEVFEHFAAVHPRLRSVDGRVEDWEQLDTAPFLRAHINLIVEQLTLDDARAQEYLLQGHDFEAGGWTYHLSPYNSDGFPVFKGYAEPTKRTARMLRGGA